MDKTRLEHDLATSESKRVVSRKNLLPFILALVLIIALLFLYNIFSAIYGNRERIEKLETQIETMQTELQKARVDEKGDNE